MRSRIFMPLSWWSILGSCKFIIEVWAHRSAAPKRVLSGLYQSIDKVPYFDGLAMRLFSEKRCALVFLAGTPAQHFLSSFETTKIEMKSYDPPGNSRRYLLFDKDCKARSTLKRARTLTTEFGQRMDFGVHTIFPRISKRRNVTLKVGDVILHMKKISDDPRKALEAPFEQPSPGVYVNDGPISDAALSSTEVTVDNERGCSLQIGLPNNSTIRHSVGYMANKGRSHRCLWFPRRARRYLLFPESSTFPNGHILRDLKPDDAGICQTPRLRLYLVLGHLNILLKPALNATSQRPLRTPRQSNREMLHTHRKRSSEPKPASEPRNQDRHVKVAKKAPRITIGPPATATEAATKTDGPLLEPTQTKRPSRAAEYLVNYPDIDSRLPPSITKSALSRPTRRESRRASGESGQVELLRQGEPPNFNDESGEKSALIGPRGWESGDRPEFHAVSPPGVEHRSSLESANAAPHLMSPDGRGGGEPVADLLASLEGWVVKPSTQPQKPRSISVQPAADGTLASERQENSLAASISHGLAENKPGEELRYTENTGKRGSKPVDYGPKTTVSAVDPSGSASGGDLDGFGYLQKVDSTGAEGKASGTNEARSLRPSDEDTTLETQLSFIDGEIPEWSPTSAEKQDVEIDPDFDALFVSPNITWSDLLSAEPVAVPSGAGEESQDLSLDEKLAIEAQGLLDFLDSDKQ